MVKIYATTLVYKKYRLKVFVYNEDIKYIQKIKQKDFEGNIFFVVPKVLKSFFLFLSFLIL